MKNLYKTLFCLLALSSCIAAYSQEYITWDPVNGGTQVDGSYGTAGIATVSLVGTPTNVIFDSQPVSAGTANLLVGDTQMFSTKGPSDLGPANGLQFTFSTPVIITRFNMADIDLDWNWDDSFNFANITFTNNPAPTSTNCTATLGGAEATVFLDANEEFASWFCSDHPITGFNVNYLMTGGLTTAYLAYSIEILEAPMLNPVCVGDIPSFPIVGNGIVGTWSPSTINTSEAGTTVYTFTPRTDQPILCPITMDVTVIDCCIPTAVLSTPADDMDNNSLDSISHIERGNWISASNVIGIGNSIFQDGVVYHAGNFVDLTPGFDAINGSQFLAYPLGCTNNSSASFIYKNQETVTSTTSNENSNVPNAPKSFNLFFNKASGTLEVKMINDYMNGIAIYSLDGKEVISQNFNTADKYECDISRFAAAVYIVTVHSKSGKQYSQKLIKN